MFSGNLTQSSRLLSLAVVMYELSEVLARFDTSVCLSAFSFFHLLLFNYVKYLLFYLYFTAVLLILFQAFKIKKKWVGLDHNEEIDMQ